MARPRVGPWVLGALLWCACRSEGDAPAVRAAPSIEDAAALAPDLASNAAPDASEPDASEDASTAPAEVAASVPRASDDGARPPPSVVTPLPELCRQACANTLRVLSAELPADAAPAMRAELERSLGAECHARCMRRASMASAQCIAAATSALDLAACR